ncbi:MAG: hypothetical protein HON90_12985 [Halobacteriovoraceae bacterium]|jgi:uncharacterized protein (DUF58 family)|nr:hypothetical protein [Halobacteriovoraceae bacterium]
MKSILKNFEKRIKKKTKVYIVPSKAGLKFIFINFTLFLIALSYANNMALLITFIMVSYFIIQMLDAHKIIADTDLDNAKVFNQFSNKDNEMLLNLSKSPEHSIDQYLQVELISESKRLTISKILKFADNTLKYALPSQKRDRYSYNNLKFFTYGAQGLFYVWRYFPVEINYFVYPERKGMIKNILERDNNSKSQFSEAEFSHYLPYTQGLSSKRIDWKIYAKKDLLYWKKHIDYQDETISINFQHFDGDIEQKLQQMSYLIDKSFKNNQSWKLTLPTCVLPTSKGFSHYKNSLEVISEF